MKHATKFVIATALFSLSLMSFMGISQTIAYGQEQTAKKEATGEVDRLIAELNKKQETVVKACLEHCDSQKHDNQEITGGEFDERVEPDYPPIARAAHASGNVVVLVIVDEEGKVIAAQSLSGHPLLQAAAVRAARASTFHPYVINGQPVKVRGTINYRFLIP